MIQGRTGSQESELDHVKKPSLSLVGDGGASWRLKALKRAQEQAEREGRKLDEVVKERWDSVETLTSSVSVRRAAHANAHLHATRNRKYRKDDKSAEGGTGGDSSSQVSGGDRHRDRSSRMGVPTVESALSWKSKKKYEYQPLRDEDATIIRKAAKSLNKYANDGSFLKSYKADAESILTSVPLDENLAVENPGGSNTDSVEIVYEPTRLFKTDDSRLGSNKIDEGERPHAEPGNPSATAHTWGSTAGLSANQVAAKAMRLRLMGKAKDAEDLLKEFGSSAKDKPNSSAQGTSLVQCDSPRPVMGHGLSMKTGPPREKFSANNRTADAVLAGNIVGNKRYKGNVDDEYDDYAYGMETEHIRDRKRNKDVGKGGKLQALRGDVKRIVTQQEQCKFCFENSRRPKHLVIAIGNFTYLMIPQTASLVPYHCYIVPMQHDGAIRNVDESVWQEVRNFKKCLAQMFGSQGKDVLFLETAMALSRQRRHCYVECIPVPADAAEDAPLYFKKAIDEAEDEWSQHDAKKIIDTRQKDLRKCIPKNFPYFHVEFGLNGGYCHIIDDENKFNPHFGRDVVAGILEVSDDDVPRDSRHELPEQQSKKLKAFLKLWEPFDWTKMLA